MIISFSLWGDCKLYNYGALENALLSPEVYPGWGCRFYMGRGVIPGVRERLVAMPHVSIVDVDEEDKFSNTLWRFRPAFETDETVIVRDCDSRLNIREKLAVDEWLASGRDFHIMRDHPKGHWGRVLGGMWGARNGILRRFLPVLEKYSEMKTNKYFHDMDLLVKEVYPHVVDDSMVHDEHFRYEAHARPFPKSDYGGFVGEVIKDCSRASRMLGDMASVFQKVRCQVP
jgi:hypothetical protein